MKVQLKLISYFFSTFLIFCCSQLMLFAEDNQDSLLNIRNEKELIENKDSVNFLFKTVDREHLAGDVIVIDVEKELDKDLRTGLGALITGKLPGVLGALNVWGIGQAAVFVDGMERDQAYIFSMNMREVETITILKDATSKALYGTYGNTGVILVKTKRGRPGDFNIRISGEYGTAKPKILPNYLSTPAYMQKFTEAQLNDGLDEGALRYSQQNIEEALSGSNPILYPDNDFYSSEYLKSSTNSIDLFLDASGGNENATYYLNTSWYHNDGWLNIGDKDITDRLNVRGNIDVDINDFITMIMGVTGRFLFGQSPNTNYASNINSYWQRFSSELPNAYPILWNPEMITDSIKSAEIINEAQLIDGMIPGGNSSYLNNLYADLTINGISKQMERDVQFATGLNFDLGDFTEGLSAKVYGSMSFYNAFTSAQNPLYAVYEPVFDSLGILDDVVKYGEDKMGNRYDITGGDFNRRYMWYSTLNYDRSFGKHHVNSVAMVYNNQHVLNDNMQSPTSFHSGVSTNYSFDKRFIAELNFIAVGSRKFAKREKFSLAPSLGLAWVLSNEEFLADMSFVNFLKIRTSLGINKNDYFDDYYLYRYLYQEGASFVYNNGNSSNRALIYSSVKNDIDFQKRRDFSIGLDAAMFESALKINLGYFNSSSYDNVTLMNYTFPQVIGYQNLVYDNYNSYLNQGFEFGTSYDLQIGNWSLSAGANLLWQQPKIIKIEEFQYQGIDKELMREGTAGDAMWGLVSDGLYGEGDFNEDGTLIESLPIPTFSEVQAGDIKYLDKNDDGVIDNRDRRIIGNWSVRTQVGLFLQVRYKGFAFYMQGIGRMGSSAYRTGDYHWIAGNMKYPEYVNEAYGPNNKDLNANYPRLSVVWNNNNYRLSDYWLYSNNSFTIPTMQFSYKFNSNSEGAFLKNSEIYLRATDMVVMNKNKKYSELNIDSAPQTRTIAIGFVTSF